MPSFTMYHTLLHFLQTLLFPAVCIGCKRYGKGICSTCLTTLPDARSLANEHDYAVFDYGDPLVHKALRQLKYRHNSMPAQYLVRHGAVRIQRFITAHMKDTSSAHFFFVPIPQHKIKTRLRGYNQSLLIAQWLTKEIPTACIAQVLEKTINTVSQTKTKSRTERIKNTADTMSAVFPINPDRLYVLVDDITTTGATLNEARRALLQSGAKKVLSVSIGHGFLSLR